MLTDLPIKKVKEFEQAYLEQMRARHRDILDELKQGKLNDGALDTMETLCKELIKKFIS